MRECNESTVIIVVATLGLVTNCAKAIFVSGVCSETNPSGEEHSHREDVVLATKEAEDDGVQQAVDAADGEVYKTQPDEKHDSAPQLTEHEGGYEHGQR